MVGSYPACSALSATWESSFGKVDTFLCDLTLVIQLWLGAWTQWSPEVSSLLFYESMKVEASAGQEQMIGESKPAELHTIEARLAFCSVFSLLTRIIFTRSSLKWRKFNCSSYFLVFLPLSSGSLPILMSFISLETITSPSPQPKFKEDLGMLYQTLLAFNRSLWKL